MIAWAGLLAGMAPARAQDLPPIVLGQSVLKLEARRAQGGYALGSAVVIGPGELVTNCHVTRDAVLLTVQHQGLRWRVTAQAADAHHDLCLLRVPGLQVRVAELGSSGGLRPGDKVHAVGYTGGQSLQATSGEVVALHRLDGGQVVQSTNWFTSGASGGALFDEQQRLVGVLTFRLLGGESHYFASPVEWLATLRAQALEPVAPLEPGGTPFWQRASADQPRFLRGLKLMHDQQWPSLMALATDWLRSGDADDAQPWYLAGMALHQLGRTPDARQALRCALQREPRLQAANRLLAQLAAAPAGDEGASANLRAAAPAPTGPAQTGSGRCTPEGWG